VSDQHTEAPWKWSANCNRLDGRVDTVLEAGSGSDIFGCTTFEIEHHYDPDVAAANRRLIEAAPEMLDLLRQVRKCWNAEVGVALDRDINALLARIDNTQEAK
jgi:hypothetical protein